MTRTLILVAVLALMAFSVPAIPQGNDDKARVVDLLRRIEALELITAEQQDALAEHHIRLEKAEAWIKRQNARHAHIVELAVYSQKKGFLYPAPNIDARGAILHALHVLNGGKAKLPPRETVPPTPGVNPYPPTVDD